MAVYLTNSFEGGTSGTGVTTSNSGGNSGNAFNAVTLSNSATVNYSNTFSAHGSLSAEFTEASTTGQCFVVWSTSLTATSITQAWFRVYCYFTAFPEASLRLVSMLSSGAFAGCLSISSSTGKWSLTNAAGTVQTLTNGLTASTNAIPTNAWFRFEGYFIGSATVGQVSASMYDTMDSTTATETETTAATLNTTGAINGLRFGSPSDGISYSFYLDDLGASDTGYLGPALLSGSSSVAGTGALADSGQKTGSGPSSLAGSGLLADTGSKTASGPSLLAATGSAVALGSRRSLGTSLVAGTGSQAGAGAKKTTAASLVTATGLLAAASAIPSASAVAATASMRSAGLKTVAGASAISASGGLKAFPPPHSPAFTTGYPRSRWNAGSPQTRWQAGYPLMRWPAGQ